MHAEILAIGSELTSGAKLDTNSQWLSTELAGLGMTVVAHATVADDIPTMLDALRIGVQRSDLLLVTGGLGPTQDDLTRQALAQLVGRDLVRHEPSLEHVQSMFARRGRSMPERNQIQAMFPQGSEVLVNPVGTAPGIWIEVPRSDGQSSCRVAAMPGVPSEMRRMFREQVVPRLPHGHQVIRHACVHCFGAGESTIEEMLGDLTAREREPEVGITAHEATITLRITAHGRSEQECIDKIDRTKAQVRARLGNLVFGEEDDDLARTVVRALTARQLRLATAEAGTYGLLTHWLARADAAGHSFVGGLAVPNAHYIPVRRLANVPGIPDDGVLLNAAAEAWAKTCRQAFDAQLGLAAVVQPTEPGADEPGHGTPISAVALAGDSMIKTAKCKMSGNPAIFESLVVKTALDMLRLYLLDQSRP